MLHLTSGKKPLKYIKCVSESLLKHFQTERTGMRWSSRKTPTHTQTRMHTHTHTHTERHVYKLFINLQVTTNNTVVSFKEIKKIRNNFRQSCQANIVAVVRHLKNTQQTKTPADTFKTFTTPYVNSRWLFFNYIHVLRYVQMIKHWSHYSLYVN
jgi:3'-phosphoadenosine 5'-phosphosulfate sulfotransferase (PAPS reductase)/FAD synthetase